MFVSIVFFEIADNQIELVLGRHARHLWSTGNEKIRDSKDSDENKISPGDGPLSGILGDSNCEPD